MRRFVGSVIACLTIFFAAPTRADFYQDRQLCEQYIDDHDAQIAACTRQIESGYWTGNRLAFRYHNRGNAHSYKHEYSLAIADYSNAISIYPDYVNAIWGRANAYQNAGDDEHAIADYNRVIQLGANRDALTSAYTGLGSAYLDMGDIQRAIANYDQAMQLNPKEAYIYNDRGNAYNLSGEYDKAIMDFTRAVSLNPKYELAFSNRGDSWRLKGDLGKAILDQNKSIELDPQGAVLYISRGDTYRYLGDYDHALADYEKANSVFWDHDYIAAFVGRGLTYEKMGDVDRARKEFERALHSRSEYRSDIALRGLATAQAHLAALDSGAAPPVIPAIPAKASSASSVPTLAANVPPKVEVQVASQGRRVALVIGNSTYMSVPTLRNPQHDAQKMASSLRAMGFNIVTLVTDVNRAKFIESLRNFAAEADKADWALVYYSGHGIEMDGKNYLVPVDAKIEFDRDVQFETVSLDQVLTTLEGTRKLRLVMLDACRANPFPDIKYSEPAKAAALDSDAGTVSPIRAIGRGLIPVQVSKDTPTLLIYAAKQGQVALDGEGENSPFAVAVIQRIATPGVELSKLFRLVRDDVMEATAGRQEPYTYGSLPGSEDFYFVQKR